MTQTLVHKQRKQLSNVEEFERWLSKKKTDHNYEFVRGQVIKKNGIKQRELFIVSFLLDVFRTTAIYEKGGILASKIDVYIDDYCKRVSDLACFTAEQIKATRHGQKVVPSFVIELLSDSESFDDVEAKIQDYFDGSTLDAGVQVVWYINPKTQTIYSYTSPKSVKICSDTDVCDAVPAVPDFKFEVREMFAERI